MKHIVTLTISNPAHEHISLRRRQSTTNYMVEARDEAEAIFRASNHFKKLGNYVHNAVIAESTLNEEVEQIDEEDIKKSKVMHKGKEIGEVGIDTEASPGNGKWYAKHHASGMDTLGHDSKKDAVAEVRWVHDANRETNEEVEQIDEAVKVGPANHDKSTDTVWHGVHHDGKEIGTIGTNSAQHVEKHGKWGFEDSRGYGRRHGEPEMNSKEEALDALVNRHKEYAKKKTNEEVEQIDELKKSTLASYITKASRQSGALYSLGKEFDNDKYMYAKKALNARTPKTKEQAKTNMETSGKLANRFTRKAYNRVAGVSLAAAKLAKEEVESIDEVNARHSPEAAQAVLTPTAKIVRAAVGKTARDKASTKKYARRVAKISPDYSKKDVMGSLKSMGEEVEQIDEKAPPGAKYERMVKHIKNQYSKDGTLTPQEKAIAYATAWKAKNAGK